MATVKHLERDEADVEDENTWGTERPYTQISKALV